MRTPSESLRSKWLKAALPLVSEQGWTAETLASAARAAGLSEGEVALATPGGVNDLIDHFFDEAIDSMLENLVTEDLGSLRVHERVAAGLKSWLAVLEPNKDAVRKAAARGMLPWGAGAATRQVWRTADAIWEAAGDTATDYNRHTKRALLSAVIPSVVLHWLETEDEAAVDRYIMQRLKQAMRLGQTGGKLLGPVLNALNRSK